MPERTTNKTEDFDLEAIKSLIEEGRQILTMRNIAVEEWESKTDADKKLSKKRDDAITKFFIPKSVPAIHEGINSAGDAEVRIKELRDESKKLQDIIYDILDNNEKGMEKDLLKTVNTICSIVEKFNRTVWDRMQRFKPSEFNSIQELTDAFSVEVANMVKKMIIEVLVPALYHGIKYDYNSIYDLVLNGLNQFLQGLGIYTADMKPGTKIDYNICKVSEDSKDNITSNHELYECVEEVRQYPYFMGSTLLAEGVAYVWRRE